MVFRFERESELDVMAIKHFGNDATVMVRAKLDAGFVEIGHLQDAQVLTFGRRRRRCCGLLHRSGRGSGFCAAGKASQSKGQHGNNALQNHSPKEAVFAPQFALFGLNDPEKNLKQVT